jgi:hypothetical protein
VGREPRKGISYVDCIKNGALGVDTVRVGGPVGTFARGEPGWSVRGDTRAEGRRDLGWLRTLPGGGRLDVVSLGAGQRKAFIEFSVPKILNGENVVAADIEAVGAAVKKVRAEASEFVSWESDSPSQVNRLDCVRDFTGISEIGGVLQALNVVQLKGVKTGALYRDPNLNGAQTLAVFNKSGGGRLYDKFAESGNAAATGRLRFEAVERARGLRGANVRYLPDITEGKVKELAQKRFEWAGFDLEVSKLDEMLARLERLDLTDGQRLQAAGYLLFNARGTTYQFSKDRRYRNRRIMETLGGWADEHSNRTWRLDFVEGLQAA